MKTNIAPNPCAPFIAVRGTEGYQWFDIGTISHDADDCRNKAKVQGEQAGTAWVKANPVIGVVVVELIAKRVC